MNDQYLPELIDATPNDVLLCIRESHRHQCAYDPDADNSIELTSSTTIAEWRRACDLVSAPRLGRALNEIWCISCPEAEWAALLEPAKTRTLGEVCDRIAWQAKIPRIRPWKPLNMECLSAGAFLTVRSMLIAAGAKPRGLTPSTPLHEYTRRYTEVFIHDITRLAPGALPKVSIQDPLRATLLAIFALSFLACTVIGFFALPALCSLCALCLISMLRVPHASVRFGSLHSFRDLAEALAREVPALP